MCSYFTQHTARTHTANFSVTALKEIFSEWYIASACLASTILILFIFHAIDLCKQVFYDQQVAQQISLIHIYHIYSRLKDRRGYSHLKEEALERTMWRHHFGGGFGPVVRQTTEWMNEWINSRLLQHLVSNVCG